MLLVSSTYPVAKRFGDEKSIELFAEAGFDALDYSAFFMDSPLCGSDYKDYALYLKKFAENNGISFVQAHAPMITDSDEKHIAEAKQCTIKAIEGASIMGAEVIVVHPLHYLDYADNAHRLYELNMEFFGELIKHAEKFGIRIACENLFQVKDDKVVDSVCSSSEEFCRYIDTIASPYLTACLDLGHCNVCGRDAEDIIMAMGDRIGALHIHDNDGVADLHKLPGTVSMNWDNICKALKDIDYKGNFTFEVNGYLNPYSDDFVPTALKFLHDVGRHFISKINSYQK